MRPNLGAIERVLSGRTQIEHKGDPIVPWVKRTARILMDRMGSGPQAGRDAEAAYAQLVQDARAQAAQWRSQGEDRLVKRLSVLLKTNL